MKKANWIIIFLLLGQSAWSQNIGDFTSVIPLPSYQQLNIPSTHTFQVLLQEGDSCNNGVLPGLFDFSCFIAMNGSSIKGQLSLNHENIIGDVSISDIELKLPNQLWEIGNTDLLDFSNFVEVYRPCSGNLTPWGTLVVGEEYLPSGDLDSNGLLDAGWVVEINPTTRTVIQKVWSAGRCEHENAVVTADSSTLYTGADNLSFGYVYKYVLHTKGVLDSGDLYALKVTDSTGVWLPIPNNTDSQKNVTANYALALGATNFIGVEDIELGPDGKVYFATKGNGNIYRFLDEDSTVALFDTFVVSQNYLINWGIDSALVPWSVGADNMAFDNQGNLWVQQDGGNNYIWTVGNNHTKQQPNVKLFGRVPIGSEPTGITFTPDGKYLFMSLQHPYPSNIDTQYDASGRLVQWNRNTTIVIARKEFLGSFPNNLFNVNRNNLIIEILQNPFKNEALFKLPSNNDLVFTLYDLSGRRLKSGTANGTELRLNMHSFESGIYFVEFYSQHGKRKVIKLLKQ